MKLDGSATGRVTLVAEEWQTALARQQDEGAHDRSLIVERLAWTPEQRLAANGEFLRFYLALRPAGPIIDGD
jgi:hypothetical protein